MSLTDFNIPRTDWLPDGPWNNEDDREEFDIDGVPCVLQRDRLGYWCGYVLLSNGHPWANKSPEQIKAQVYGAVKHVGDIPEKAGKWAGFACNEPGDLLPGMMKWKRESLSDGIYRDFDFAMNECAKLAAAAKKASK